MTTTQAVLCWSAVILGVLGSALFSGMETGTYRLNRVRLHLLDHQGWGPARVMRRLISHPASMLATLLIGNNLVNYMSTAGLTVILESWQLGDTQVILLNVVIVTPLLFIFGEILPKDTFHAYADVLVYRLARPLDWFRRLCVYLGLVPALIFISNGVMKLLGVRGEAFAFHPRRQMGALVKESVGYGLISDEQSAIVSRVLELAERTVEDEMVPWRQVEKVHADDAPQSLWEVADRTSTSRFPVVDQAGEVLGAISIYHVMEYEPESCPPIRELMRPISWFDRQTPSRVALGRLQREDLPIAIVSRDDRPVGIVTLKDLIEPITGELATW